jgi:hypothetical protein
MKVRIISDGTFLGTRVVNAETDEPIEGVYSVEFQHDVQGFPYQQPPSKSAP